MNINKLVLTVTVFCFAFVPYFESAIADEKMKPEELVAKHLDSLGNADARAKITSRMTSGPSQFVIRVGGTANLSGQAMLVASGAKFRLGIQFQTADYVGEDMAFDGNKVTAGFQPGGSRSPLSLFATVQSMPLKEGLVGGVLSTAWPLLHIDQSQPKLEYRGLKKIDGRQLHELGYRPRKGSTDLKTLLYFDPETFRHVRTRYQYEVAAMIGSRDNPNANQESYYSVTEEFDDFRTVDGLTLPRKYKLLFNAEGGKAALIQEWAVSFDRISHNPKLDDALFTIK
ncbi:MAG: hypothetical protein JST85_10175 [Acidobacteria bacterium]|nr:hypothetical protein [Acidobacteriota bacterium]